MADAAGQGTTWSDLTAPILDATGAPVTAPTGIAVVLYDALDADASAGVTWSHCGNGVWRVKKPLAANAPLGAWGGVLTYTAGTLVRRQRIAFSVVTPAQAGPPGGGVRAADA